MTNVDGWIALAQIAKHLHLLRQLPIVGGDSILSILCCSPELVVILH
jgi:hypothetical protein